MKPASKHPDDGRRWAAEIDLIRLWICANFLYFNILRVEPYSPIEGDKRMKENTSAIN